MAENKKDLASKQAIKDLAKTLDINDAKRVMAFGIRAQHQLADFSANLLDQMRSVKTGDIEYPLEALLDNVQSVNLSKLNVEDTNTRRFMRKAKKALKGFNKADKRIFELEMRLDAIKGDLLRDVVLLGKLKDKNKAHRRVLETYIAAGERVLDEQVKAVQAKPSSVLEEQSALSVLDKRIHNLKLARTIALQVDPQITLIQNTNKTLIERIQTSLLSTLPLWRNQMVLANTLIKQKTVMNMEKALSATADAKLKASAEALKHAIAKGENPLEAVKKAGEELVETIEAVKAVYQSGEADIKTALTTMKTLKENIKKAE